MDPTPLLRWYRRERRALPWRDDPTPYKVWLSEVMSQQTRIETMRPYWEGFLARWPAVEDLAAADLEEVLHAWSGLGYYSRARNLHAAAKVIAAEGFPSDRIAFQRLPGVGRYTAGAVASIAFGRDEWVVDGNVERVVCRVEDLAEDPRQAAARRRIEGIVEGWLPAGEAGDWNQALMELGARVCTPKKPACGRCPIAEECKALEAGTVLSRPDKPRRTRQPEVRSVAVVVRSERGVLMARRPEDALLGGLWELPRGDDLEALRARIGPVELGRELGSVRHIFSHRKLTLQVFEARLARPAPGGFYTELRWVEDPETLALSTLARKALRAGRGAPAPTRASGRRR